MPWRLRQSIGYGPCPSERRWRNCNGKRGAKPGEDARLAARRVHGITPGSRVFTSGSSGGGMDPPWEVTEYTLNGKGTSTDKYDNEVSMVPFPYLGNVYIIILEYGGMTWRGCSAYCFSAGGSPINPGQSKTSDLNNDHHITNHLPSVSFVFSPYQNLVQSRYHLLHDAPNCQSIRLCLPPFVLAERVSASGIKLSYHVRCSHRGHIQGNSRCVGCRRYSIA